MEGQWHRQGCDGCEKYLALPSVGKEEEVEAVPNNVKGELPGSQKLSLDEVLPHGED
jgi:hypothetical protein